MKKILFACCILLFSHSLSFAKFDPAFRWTTLETPHFRVHYHQGGEAIARKAAATAEDVHSRLTPRIKWEPKEKTEIVLVDAMDESNGMASPLPYNQIVLLLTQPVGAPGFGATPYEDWMRMVITHEYTHILQMDMVYGGYGWLMQTLFGRSPLSFPNAIQPVWLLEGLATYEETEQTSGGRGRSAGADMVLRMATLEGPFPLLSQMTVFPDTWPSGQVPYLFGESFTRFIAHIHGREKLAGLSVEYSQRNFPFLVNSTAKRSLGSYYGRLYREWRASLQDRYGKQREIVEAKGMTSSTALTQKGYEALSPAYSPDGSRIAYFVSNGDEFPGVYIMKADGSEDRKLLENLFPSSASGMTLAWSPDGGRLYYTKLEFVRNTHVRNDLYCYDIRNGREIRLTEDLRGRDPHPSPDGTRLVFVVNRMGMTRLALLDLSEDRSRPAREGEITYLSGESPLQYETPRWSPDGSKIAVGVWQPGGYKDIWILDAEGKKLAETGRDRAIDSSPSWSPDGKHLYFTSDRTGIYNLYAYELETGTLYRITNVLGGAFLPNPSPDNKKLAFASYSSRGYDIHTLDIGRASWKPAEPYTDPYPATDYREPEVDVSTRPYNPLPTLLPTFWLPWFGYSSESGGLGGFLTFGQDVVQRHQYIASGLYGPRNSRFWYSLDYLYDGLYPTIHLSASDQDETYSNLLEDASGGTADYGEGLKAYGIEMIVPLVKAQKQHAAIIGYRWREASALTDLTPWQAGPQPFEGVLASGRASYLFNNAKRYNFSISPEDGRTVELGYERFSEALGSDLDLHKYTADWHEYLGLPGKHQVLQVRAFAGTSTGATTQEFPQGVFQLGGDMPGDVTLSIDDRDVYLRGYPAARFRGQNVALASLEYRFPIMNIERGGAQIPFFLRRLHGAVFAEAGNVWDAGAFHADDAKRGVGAELRLDLDMFYGMLPATLRLGFARGLDEQGEAQVIVNLWLPLGI